jgi:ferredoxin
VRLRAPSACPLGTLSVGAPVTDRHRVPSSQPGVPRGRDSGATCARRLPGCDTPVVPHSPAPHRRASPSALVTCVPRGDVLRPRPGETLLQAALRSRVPLASSCGGRAVCGDCLLRVLSGADRLSPPTPAELAWRARTGRGLPGPAPSGSPSGPALGSGSPPAATLRLACCATVHGPVAVTTTYW